MLTLAVCGASGRTGGMVVAAIAASTDVRLVAATCRAGSERVGRDAGAAAGVRDLAVPLAPLDGAPITDADVVIDFSSPAALADLLPRLRPGQALVTGTTGLDAAGREALVARAADGPVLEASNFSPGVAVLVDLARRAVSALPGYDVEIIEAHHRHKVDAPSGTALTLAHAVCAARGLDPALALRHGRHGAAGPRPGPEIGVHALRGGGVVGEHEVWIVGDTERVSLGHSATTRAAFAEGALRAARWLAGRPPGTYRLSDALGLTSL
jgi:4-hydroxy-tetrahydrodipicolinate reductase